MRGSCCAKHWAARFSSRLSTGPTNFAGELSLGVLLAGTVGLPTNVVPVRGYAKGGDAENIEFVGIAA